MPLPVVGSGILGPVNWRAREKYGVLVLAAIAVVAFLLGAFTDDDKATCPGRSDATTVRLVDGVPSYCVYTLTDGRTVTVERP